MGFSDVISPIGNSPLNMGDDMFFRWSCWGLGLGPETPPGRPRPGRAPRGSSRRTAATDPGLAAAAHGAPGAVFIGADVAKSGGR